MTSKMIPIKILKQQVQAKTRALSARWTFEPPIDMDHIANLKLAELVKRWYVAKHGFHVPLYENDHEADYWAADNINCAWYSTAHPHDPALYSDDRFAEELTNRLKSGDINPEPKNYYTDTSYGIDVESEIMAALFQEISAEIDKELIGSITGKPYVPPKVTKPALKHYYFMDRNEALRFKLTWGGE